MAKPIRATPKLVGSDAKIFIEAFIKEEKMPSKKRLKLIKSSLSLKFNIN